MPRVDYRSTSPYFETPQLTWRLGRYVHRPVPVTSTDTEITIDPKYHNRPDKLSHDLYGTPDYYWVFMARNMNLIRDPIWDLKAGMRIFVPSREAIGRISNTNA